MKSQLEGSSKLIRPLVRLEKRIEHLLIYLVDKKDEAFFPWMGRNWPRWITPNVITSARIAAGIVILFWLISTKAQDFQNNHLFTIIFAGLCLTDFVDGIVARALKMESRFGSWLEKVGDKILLVPIGTCEFWLIDKWLVFISYTGMITVVITATYKLSRNGHQIPDNVVGKFGMFFYCLGIILAIYPDYIETARNICWGGLYVGGVAICINLKRHFFRNGNRH